MNFYGLNSKTVLPPFTLIGFDVYVHRTFSENIYLWSSEMYKFLINSNGSFTEDCRETLVVLMITHFHGLNYYVNVEFVISF